MPPCKLELDNTVSQSFIPIICVVTSFAFFKLWYNFSWQLAIDKFLDVIEIDVTNCAIDKLVFRVIVTQNDHGKSLNFVVLSVATLSCRSLL